MIIADGYYTEIYLKYVSMGIFIPWGNGTSILPPSSLGDFLAKMSPMRDDEKA